MAKRKRAKKGIQQKPGSVVLPKRKLKKRPKAARATAKKPGK
jgi:hypothetical protein